MKRKWKNIAVIHKFISNLTIKFKVCSVVIYKTLKEIKRSKTKIIHFPTHSFSKLFHIVN